MGAQVMSSTVVASVRYWNRCDETTCVYQLGSSGVFAQGTQADGLVTMLQAPLLALCGAGAVAGGAIGSAGARVGARSWSTA